MSQVSFLVLTLLLGSGGNELLHYLDTQTYWQQQGVEVTVENMIGELEPAEAGQMQAPRAEQVQQLMAIVALGEMGDEASEALDELEGLTKSKEPFVSAYATRAIAQISGKPMPPAQEVAQKDLDQDLWSLPVDTTMVVQFKMEGSKRPDLDAALRQAAGMMGAIDEESIKQQVTGLKQELTAQLTEVAHRVGNVRFDALTVGMIGNPDADGRGVFIARGEYDPTAVTDALSGMMRGTSQIDDVTVLHQVDTRLIPLDRQRFVMMVAEAIEHAPVEPTVRILQQGKGGGLTESEPMTVLIKQMGREEAVGWGVVRILPEWKREEVIGAFDSATVRATRVGEATRVHVEGTGDDAEQVAAAVKTLQEGLEEGKREMAEAAEQFPMANQMLDLLASTKIAADGNKATIDAEMKGDVTGILGFWMGFMNVASDQAMEHHGEAEMHRMEEADVAPGH